MLKQSYHIDYTIRATASVAFAIVLIGFLVSKPRSPSYSKSDLRNMILESVRLKEIGLIDSSLRVNNRALQLAMIHNDTLVWVQGLINTASIHYLSGSYDSSELLIDEAHGLALKCKNDTALLETNYWLGFLKTSHGNIAQGWPYLLESEAILKRIGEARPTTYLYISMAYCFSELQNNKRALEYYEKARNSAIKQGNKRKAALVRAQIAYEYVVLDSIDGGDMLLSALNDFDESITKMEHNRRSISYLRSEVGLFYLRFAMIDRARELLTEVRDLSLQHDYWKGLVNSNYGLAKIAMLDKELPKALDYLKSSEDLLLSLDVFTDMEKFKLLKNVYSEFSELYEAYGDLEKSIEYLALSRSCGDSLALILNTIAKERTEIEAITRQYNFEKASLKKRNEILKSSLESTKDNQLSSTILILICLFGGYFLWRETKKYYAIKASLRNYNSNLENEVELQTQKLTRAIDELQVKCEELDQFAWIVSHNLRAPVASLKGIIEISRLIGKEELNQAAKLLSEPQKQLLQISNLLNLLAGHFSNVHSKKICRNIYLYKLLQKLVESEIVNCRMQVAVSIKVDVDEVFIDEQKLQEIVRAIVSNSMKYANEARRLKIELDAKMDQRRNLVIRISDNGDGIDLVKYGEKLFSPGKRFHINSTGLGLGLFVVRKLVQLLSGSVVLCSEFQKGTVVRLSIPVC